jgi:hypothetical protein
MSNDNDILLCEMIEVRSVSDETSYASEETISRRRKHQAIYFANFYIFGRVCWQATIGPSTLSCTIPILPTLTRAVFGASLLA